MELKTIWYYPPLISLIFAWIARSLNSDSRYKPSTERLLIISGYFVLLTAVAYGILASYGIELIGQYAVVIFYAIGIAALDILFLGSRYAYTDISGMLRVSHTITIAQYRVVRVLFSVYSCIYILANNVPTPLSLIGTPGFIIKIEHRDEMQYKNIAVVFNRNLYSDEKNIYVYKTVGCFKIKKLEFSSAGLLGRNIHSVHYYVQMPDSIIVGPSRHEPLRGVLLITTGETQTLVTGLSENSGDIIFIRKI